LIFDLPIAPELNHVQEARVGIAFFRFIFRLLLEEFDLALENTSAFVLFLLDILDRSSVYRDLIEDTRCSDSIFYF
jgi:hypothetical protein